MASLKEIIIREMLKFNESWEDVEYCVFDDESLKEEHGLYAKTVSVDYIYSLNIYTKNRIYTELSVTSQGEQKINSVYRNPPIKRLPTTIQVSKTREKLLLLLSRRLIQFIDARDNALKSLKTDAKVEPDINAAILYLENTKVSV